MQRKRWLVGMAALVTLVPALGVNLPALAAQNYTGLAAPYQTGVTHVVTKDGPGHGPGRHANDLDLVGENVLAMKSGKVVYRGWDNGGTGGNMIVVDHQDGFCAFYIHLNKYYVPLYAGVATGSLIAQSGHSGAPDMPWHLHVAVVYKVNGKCVDTLRNEVPMVFNGKSSELRTGQSLTSGGSTAQPPAPDVLSMPASSSLSVTPDAVNLNVCAANLAGRMVYVSLYRGPVGGNPERLWRYQRVATSSCMVWGDLDGPGPTYSGVTYFTRAALTPISDSDAKARLTACYAATGGRGLCDARSR